MNIILASKSPRRTEILSMMNIDHLVIPSKEKEVIDPTLTPTEVVMSLAYQKAKSIAVNHPNDLVIGADTIVVINNEILGKPKDYNDAVRMLSLLENNTHQVITGVSIIKGNYIDTFYVVSNVTFKPMTKEDIDNYISLENVYDKAGSYAIQGEHATFIDHIEGDYYNIVGLPKDELQKHLDKVAN
jgi:septum formation protein